MSSLPRVFFECLTHSAPDALIVACAGRIVLVSDRAEEMLGHSQEELLGLEVERLIEESNRATWAKMLSGAGPSVQTDLHLDFLRKEGSACPIEATLRRLVIEKETFIVLSIREASQRRRIEERLKMRMRQQTLVAELGRRALTGIDLPPLLTKAVNLVRRHLRVDYCNVLELRPDGRVLFQAGSGWQEERTERAAIESQSAIPAVEVLRSQKPVLIDDLATDDRFPEATLLRAHGVVSSLNVPLYGHQRPFGVLGVHTRRRHTFTEEDISFVQSVANVLSAAIERQWLEQRQHDRNMLRAEQMMAIGQVAAGVAHELRNPLTSIKGLVQVNLREAKIHGLPADDLGVIEHEIRRMERTLQTFLDFARPPQPERRRLNPAAVVERVFALVAGRARKQQVSLRLIVDEQTIEMEADQDQLQQLLLNLILNALDAMPQGGAVEVEFRPAQDGYGEMVIRDTGPGISATILPKVFETFVSSKETGVGLGLPVSRRIAEDHGGTLSAYNLPHGGACFVLRLPVGKDHQDMKQTH